APTDMRLPLYMARDAERSLQILIHDCESDFNCAQRFPNLRHRLEMLLARLDAHPQRVGEVHPRTAVQTELRVHRLTVSSVLWAAMYTPTTQSLVPLLIDQAEKGNFSGFLALRAALSPLAETTAFGMQYSVLCSEDTSRIPPGLIERTSEGTFLGSQIADLRLKLCASWPQAQIEPAYFANSASDVPALILSGGFDPITPPVWGDALAARWKNSRHVVVAGAAHNVGFSGCVVDLMAQFLDDGTAAKLDASCIQRLRRPPFFLGPDG